MRSPYELTRAIDSTDERYNDSFLVQSTVPAQSTEDFLQIIFEHENSIIQRSNSIGHCIWVVARLAKKFADLLLQRILGLISAC